MRKEIVYPVPKNGYAGRLSSPPIIYEGIHLSDQEIAFLVALEQSQYAFAKRGLRLFWKLVEE